MKILLTALYYKPHVGGIENSLFYLARVYQKQGHDVLILVSDSPSDNSVERLPGDELIDGIRVVRFRSYVTNISAFKVLKYVFEVKSCIKFFKKLEFKPELIIARNHITGYSAAKAGFNNIVYLIPGVVRFQDRQFSGKKSNDSIIRKLKNLVLSQLLIKYLEKIQFKFLKNAVKIFVFSTNMKNQVLNVVPFAEKKIFLTRPGIDPQYFVDTPIRSAARVKIGLPENAFVYLILSRLVLQKSIDLAIKAFNILKDNNAKLVIVGDGPESDSLKQLVNDLNLSPKVIFIGKTSKPDIFYAAANVYLLPSVHEPFGQTILEALYAGIPVLAFNSNEPGIETASSEIISNGKTGILVKYSVEHFAEAMIEIKNNYTAYQIDRDAVIENYSWEKLAVDLITS